MMTPFEHLRAKLKHAQGIEADAVRVDIEELASVLDELERLRNMSMVVNQSGDNCTCIKHVGTLYL